MQNIERLATLLRPEPSDRVSFEIRPGAFLPFHATHGSSTFSARTFSELTEDLLAHLESRNRNELSRLQGILNPESGTGTPEPEYDYYRYESKYADPVTWRVNRSSGDVEVQIAPGEPGSGGWAPSAYLQSELEADPTIKRLDAPASASPDPEYRYFRNTTSNLPSGQRGHWRIHRLSGVFEYYAGSGVWAKSGLAVGDILSCHNVVEV